MAEHGAVVYTFAAPGTLGANWVIYLELANAFMPRHVSVVGTNSSNALLSLGVSGATTAVLDTKDFGDSGDPAEYGPSDFADADYQFAKGDIMVITVDYDGASGTAVADPCIVVTGLLGA